MLADRYGGDTVSQFGTGTNAEDEQQTYVGVQPPNSDDSEGWHDWEQDPDTLDTWFSSSLWTWSTLIDQDLAGDFTLSLEELLKKSPDYQAYHPTSVLETGWDILFFWVARMILSTTFVTGTVPFKTVYLHGMIRAEDGKKMSKSRPESIVNPLDVIPKYGTDALRMALIWGNTPGFDMSWSFQKVESTRNFCNKLWNVARFIEDRAGDDFNIGESPEPKTNVDHWMLSKLQQLELGLSKDLEQYQFSEGFDKLYHFVWDDFADWYIESSKLQPNLELLAYGLQTILKLLHPFAPFITETIWQTLAWSGESILAKEAWPKIIKCNSSQAKEFEEVKNIVSEVRQLTSELNLHDRHLYFTDADLLVRNADLIKKLTKLAGVKQVESGAGLQLIQTKIQAWLDVESDTIIEYQTRLEKQKSDIENVIKSLEGRLANKSYVKGAPKAVVNQTKEQLAENKSLLEKVTHQQARFSS